MIRATLLGALFACTFPAATGDPVKLTANDPALAKVAWLAGSWVQVKGGEVVEEHWTQPSGGTMLGIGRTTAGGKTTFFEFLRIEKTADGITYYAHLKGKSEATPFKLTETSDTKLVFENPQHDMPQRVIYERKPDGSLVARVEGEQAGKKQATQWEFKPARL